MPWKEIGYEADQPITEDLRNADISKIEKAVRLIVEKINHATNTKTKSF